MNAILMRDRKAFAKYIFACTVFVTEFLFFNYVLARLAGVVETRSMRELWFYSALGIVALVYSAVLFIFSRFLRIGFMRDTILTIRERAFEGILRKSFRGFSRKRRSEYVSNLVNDINTFESQYFFALINIINGMTIYAFSLALLLYLEPRLGVAMFVVSLVVFVINRSFQKRTVRMQEAVQQGNEGFTVNVTNTFSGLEILKLNRIEDRFLHRSMKEMDRLERRRARYFVFTFWQGKFSDFLGTLIILGIVFYVTGLLEAGQGIARIMFLIQVSNATIWPITQVMPLYNTVKANGRIIEGLLDPGEDPPSQGTDPFVFQKELQVQDLSFQYGEKPLLMGVNFTVEKGKKYLVKGASGTGKSTLMALLSKVYEDYAGEILVDGVELRRISEKSFNEGVSFIHQEVFLFEDTLENNIALYKDYPRASMDRALEGAGLTPFLARKPQGVQTVIEENGKNLSGGERQRISIARAIIRGPALLFADEITSALDETLGRQVEETLLGLDTTLIAISHRFYPGVSDKYDFVIEVLGGSVRVKPMAQHLLEVGL